MKISSFVLASQNPGKLNEFRLFMTDVLQKHPPLRIETLAEGIPSPEETGSSFQKNAELKALYYSRFLQPGSCVVAEDSGLSVDCLNGAPGVYSSRFAGEQADDGQNIDKLLTLLADSDDRQAHFTTVIALAQGGQILASFTGTVQGRIARERAGDNGFGYDPVFYYPPLNRCFAQLSSREKNQVSHRARAMQQLRDYLSLLEIDF